MVENSQLWIGIFLLIASAGIFAAFLPRKGQARPIVRRPFFAPALTVLVIGGAAIGAVQLVAYFTTVDDITLSGKVRPVTSSR